MDLPKLPGRRITAADLATGKAIGKPYAKFTLEGEKWVQTKDIVRFNGPVKTEGMVCGRPASTHEPLVSTTYGHHPGGKRPGGEKFVDFAESHSSKHAVPARSFGLLDEDSLTIVCDIKLQVPKKLK